MSFYQQSTISLYSDFISLVLQYIFNDISWIHFPEH